MNKKSIFLLIPTFFTLLSVTSVNEFAFATSITNEQKTNVISNLKGALRIESNITSRVLGDYNVVCETDDDSFYIEYHTYNQLLSKQSYIANEEGNALQQYLTLDNKVSTRDLLDTEKNPLKFDNYFASLFDSMSFVTVNNFDTYFSVMSANNDGFVLTLTDVGYGAFYKDFIDFYQDVDGFAWDSLSLEYLIDDFVINFDKDANPIDMSLSKTKKDKFGGYKENITATLSTLDEVVGLTPHVGKMNSSSKNNFDSMVKRAMDLISGGNFTHRIEIKGTMYEYNNYYSFTGDTTNLPHMMISDLIMDDASSGETFIAVIEENSGTLKPYGFSPFADKYGSLTDITFKNYLELIPNLSLLSSDFFEVQLESDVMGNFYKFDISKFSQFDYYFADDLLRVLFGGFDPVVIYGGFFVNYNIYDYTFNSLIFQETNSGFEYTLSFTNQYGDFNAVCKFTNVGTTDITKVDRIKEGVNYIKDVYLGGN